MTTTAPTPKELAARDFYQKPEHGWTCFHCGETFTTLGTARDHFGFDPSAEPGCRIKVGAERGLLMALRKAEKECADAWFAIHNETTDAAKAYYAASARHQEQLRAAEEAGYERGIRDAREAIATTEALEAQIAELTAERDKAIKERNAFRDTGEAFVEGLGARLQSANNALSAAQERERVMREALERLESANNALCAKRSDKTYASMLEDGASDALLALDDARREARAALQPQEPRHAD